MKKQLLIPFALLTCGAFAQTPSGHSILEKVDANMTSETSITTSKMIIHGRRVSRTIESRSWSTGADNAFTEYLAPARERGTKMLKLGDRLWMYSPDTDRTIQLSGHMLRQSVMGSDLSYEDMMDDPRLAQIYAAEIVGTEAVEERPCWVLQLTANEQDVAYQSRKLWVDQERYVPVREELYAKGGKLLKRINLSGFKRIDERWYPMRMVFKDMLKNGKGTEFIVATIEFNAEIPSHILTKAALRR
ncbi:MAG: outer membrane lipoprotein-sorting protein [Kiritimatiellae bacterium]|nr:outer membrane lipoprotein-sorting protein [Kiritimatiellia bacterium]